ncbi:hypothetical protein DFH08DRAFT_966746 [Mycena albidolilacea]|uniref:F-box domain-containing protein n=1 Tax=Mycena albidolilacea TaxID=1033008 RepID=A0AAD7EJE7_9AGAR|nr:hypothetical protein DFH08DRAFT_966746 [Mycena albidolilacea]
MRLPKEVLEAIVQTILNCPTLKSCSLAGSQLREPSQCIFLHSMTLERWDSQATREFLEDSPHISAYITVLTAYIPGAKDVADDALDVTDFQWIFDRLGKARRCTLGGMDKEDPILWPSLPPALSSTYLRFISRQW